MLKKMLAASCCVALGILLGFSAASVADNWSSKLQDGSRIEVDPSTNKAIIHSPQGAEVPLWDGVHQLANGSTVTVRSGVMVPNEQVLGLRDEYRGDQAFEQQGPALCRILVRKVCGFHDECGDGSVCAQARQLLEFSEQELQEQAAPGYSSRFIETPSQCREALQRETYFVPCNKGRIRGERTACGVLADRVCGAQEQCAGSLSCIPAQQLVDMEFEERLAAENPDAPTPSTRQCQQGLENDAFFLACEAQEAAK